MWTVLILIVMILFFITGWLRADLVALIGLLGLVLTEQLTPSEAMEGFSNTATAILFIPLSIALSESMAVSPVPFVTAVAISASLAFMTPFGSPTNAMVFSVGGYRFIDFVKVGVPLQLLTGIVGILMILFLFPF